MAISSLVIGEMRQKPMKDDEIVIEFLATGIRMRLKAQDLISKTT